MSVVEVRFASPQEWERVRDLRLRALAGAPDAFGSTLEDERETTQADVRRFIEGWEGATNAMAIAEVAGAVVGMAVGSRNGEEPDAHLYAMWVEPDHRRQGIGAALVDAVLGWARSWGAASMVLGVTEGNDGAGSFYERLGFVDTGERHHLREGSERLVRIMRRPL